MTVYKKKIIQIKDEPLTDFVRIFLVQWHGELNVEFNPPRFGLGGFDSASLTLDYAGPDVVEVGDQPLRTCALLIRRLHTYSCTVKVVVSMESRLVELVNKLAVHVSR